jgi:hypothetical protein
MMHASSMCEMDPMYAFDLPKRDVYYTSRARPEVAQGLHFAILTELPSVCVCSVFAITSRSHHVRAVRIYITLVAGVKFVHPPIMQK